MNMVNDLASIIIRTKNEEEWISQCLDMIRKQSFTNYEIIVVDTGSTDKTLDIVKSYQECKIVIYDEDYMPGKALNYGCKEAKGEYLVFISAHCVPVDELWLKNLLIDLKDPLVAGVYGRQEPLENTNPFDKRDLIITFGLDKKVQWNDPFFHNANSAIKAKLWEELPFDETLTNIEDRVWTANMQKRGYCVVYEPKSSVFHHHGIHQTGCEIRCEGVNKIIDNIHSYIKDETPITTNVDKNSFGVVIPFSSHIYKDLSFKNVKILYDNLIDDLINTPEVNEIYLLTDSIELANYSKEKYQNILIPYIRKDDYKETLLGVLQDFEKFLKPKDNYSFLVVRLNSIANNRSFYYSTICKEYLSDKHSSAIWIKKNYNTVFKKISDAFYRLDDEMVKYKGFRQPMYESLDVLGMFIHIENIRRGYFHDSNVLLLEQKDDDIVIEINSDKNIEFFTNIMKG